MPRLKIENFGAGDQSWLGSTHGIRNARTETLDISGFTAGTHYPNGYIPSGTAVAKVSGLLVPYASAGTGGTAVLAGFVLTDSPVNGTVDFPVALLDHGRIKTANLPFAWTAPTAAANDATTCVYI